MTRIIEGRARVLGDAVNTDYIIASSRKRESLDPGQLRHFLLESIDPRFAASVREGDILVAGERFGSGSAMEVAVTVVQAAGIQAVVARSFSRTYFRNAINNGLLPVECDTRGVVEGASIRIEIDAASTRVVDGTGRIRLAPPLDPFVRSVLEAGGLVPFLRDGPGFVDCTP